jgi:signal transduction histidine kinase
MESRYITKIGKSLASLYGRKRNAVEAAPVSVATADVTRSGAKPVIALDHALWLIRWVTVLGLMLLSIAQPLIGRIGLPTWTLIAAFACYSGAMGLLRRRIVWLRPYSRIALVDLVVVAALYTVAASPGGPVFVLFLLLTVCASCTTTPLRGFLYTAAILTIMIVVSPTLPQWAHDTMAVRDLVARLIVVLLVNAGTMVLVHQLSHERQVAVAANLAAERQTELHRLAETFIASVSHEFRTPLTALQAGLGLLDVSLQDRLRTDEQHLLGTVRRNSERLGLLVGDLLTYNQLEMGADVLDWDRIDLSDVVTSALVALDPLLRETGHAVELQIADHLPIMGDARRLEQLLLNVIVNACEHTPAGVEIRIRSAVQGNEVVLAVSDNGPGIPPEELDRVFQPFHRVTMGINSHRRGSGLGLAIAQGIARRHEGRLWAESDCRGERRESRDENPGGTTFYVSLPLPPPLPMPLAVDVQSEDLSCH